MASGLSVPTEVIKEIATTEAAAAAVTGAAVTVVDAHGAVAAVAAGGDK